MQDKNTNSVAEIESSITNIKNEIGLIKIVQDTYAKQTDRHEDLLKAISDTQSTISSTQKCMSESISVITKFIKKHEPHLELIEKVIQTLSSIKIAIVWLAAIIGSMTVIVVASVVVWLYMTTSIDIKDFIFK